MIRKLILLIFASISIASFASFGPSTVVQAQTDLVNECPERPDSGNRLFGIFPTWYRGLPLEDGEEGLDQEALDLDGCANPVVIIGLNIFDIILRLAGLIAVIFVVVGGFKYVLSDGNPQQAADARKTIIGALVGAAIAALAATIISVVISRLGAG